MWDQAGQLGCRELSRLCPPLGFSWASLMARLGLQAQQAKMEAKQGEELMRLSEEHHRVAAHLNDLQGSLLDAQLHETHRFNQARPLDNCLNMCLPALWHCPSIF